jgi:hypothetical protein
MWLRLADKSPTLPDDTLREPHDFNNLSASWKGHARATTPRDRYGQTARPTIDVEIQLIDALSVDDGDVPQPPHLESRQGLSDQHLAAPLDKVSVALKDVLKRHVVELSRHARILNQRAFGVTGADSATDGHRERDTFGQSWERTIGSL